jgi:ABC-2 type transport system permease protein
VARVFLRLKLRLLANGLGASGGRRVGVLFGAAFGLVLSVSGYVALASLAGNPRATDGAVIAFGGAMVAWAVLPLLAFGTDDTLDPSRLAALPLTRRQLLSGLLAASGVGVAPVATLVALAGVFAGVSGGGWAARAVTGVALVLELLLCLSVSRAVTSALSGWSRSRRGRDFSVVATAVIGGAVYVVSQVIAPRVKGGLSGAGLRRLAAALRWTPAGQAAAAIGNARDQHLGAAAGELAVAAVSVVALILWWSSSLARSMITGDRSGSDGDRGGPAADLFPRPLSRVLPRNRAGAVAARDLRYAWRDPRRRADIVTALVFGTLVPLVPALRAGHLGRGHIFAVASVAVFGSRQVLNQFGTDGSALWTNLQSGGNLGADVAGKNLAVALVVGPAIVVVAVVLAALVGAWSFLASALAVGFGVLGVVMGVGDIASVLAPYPLPERTTNLYATNTGQGCATGLVQLGFLAVVGVVAAPIGAGAVAVASGSAIASVAVVPLAPAYGVLVWVVGRRVASDWLATKGPELLAAVSPARAG